MRNELPSWSWDDGDDGDEKEETRDKEQIGINCEKAQEKHERKNFANGKKSFSNLKKRDSELKTDFQQKFQKQSEESV